VGLKQSRSGRARSRGLLPQSNQRGIETGLSGRRSGDTMPGLNRTSVGLKREPGCRICAIHKQPQSNQRGIETLTSGWLSPAFCAPQSNQRGIETATKGKRRGRGEAGLNRTSVGLKPKSEEGCAWGSQEPQSNQRGIETEAIKDLLFQSERASIEPAWD